MTTIGRVHYSKIHRFPSPFPWGYQYRYPLVQEQGRNHPPIISQRAEDGDHRAYLLLWYLVHGGLEWDVIEAINTSPNIKEIIDNMPDDNVVDYLQSFA